MRKENAKAGNLLKKQLTTSNFLSDLTFQLYWAKQDKQNTELVTNVMNSACNVMVQVDSSTTGMFSCVAKLENSYEGKPLFATANPYSANGSDSSGTWRLFDLVFFCSVSLCMKFFLVVK